MESEEEEKINKVGDAVEEGEEVYYDAMEEEGNTEEHLEEEEKEEKRETRNEKEEVKADEEEDRNKNKKVRESAILRKLVYVCRIDEIDVKENMRKPCMVEISEEVCIQERRRRRKPVEPVQSRECEKSDREG